jgi:putative pyruvate formate lyase activating enzyme
MNRSSEFAELNIKLSKKHYEALVDYALSNGLENGFIQDFDSATEEYVPQFDLEGI